MNKYFTLNPEKKKRLVQICAVVFEKNASIKLRPCAPATLTLKEKNQ